MRKTIIMSIVLFSLFIWSYVYAVVTIDYPYASLEYRKYDANTNRDVSEEYYINTGFYLPGANASGVNISETTVTFGSNSPVSMDLEIGSPVWGLTSNDLEAWTRLGYTTTSPLTIADWSGTYTFDVTGNENGVPVAAHVEVIRDTSQTKFKPLVEGIALDGTTLHWTPDSSFFSHYRVRIYDMNWSILYRTDAIYDSSFDLGNILSNAGSYIVGVEGRDIWPLPVVNGMDSRSIHYTAIDFKPAMPISKKLYDDFSSGVLDQNRWEEQPASTQLVNGRLQFSLSSSTDGARNRLTLKNPKNVNSISCDMSVENVMLDTGNNTRVMSYVGGFFYNADANGTGPRGDVWASITLTDGGNGLQLDYDIFQADDNNYSNFTTIDTGILIQPGILEIGKTYKLGVTWDGINQFTFFIQGDTEAENATISVNAPNFARTPVSETLGLHLGVDSDSSTGQGSITATVDNVIINNSQPVYDDFSTDGLLSSRWNNNDFIRKFDNEKIHLMSRLFNDSTNAESSSNYLSFPKDNASYIEAKLQISTGSQVTSPDNGEAIAEMRIAGYYYNDTYGSHYNGREGDVWVSVRLRLNPDGSLQAITRGLRMSNFDGSTNDDINAFRHTFVKQINFNTEYRCSVNFDGRTFTFSVDDEIWSYTVQGNVFPASGELRRIGPMVWGDSGTMGQIIGLVDDVHVDDETSSSINQAPQAPVLTFPTDASSSVSLTTDITIEGFSDPDTEDSHTQTLWQISTSDDFSTSIVNEKTSVHLTNLTIPDLVLLENTRYFWRAKVYDSISNSSDWSQTFSFTTLDTQKDQNNDGVPDTLENNIVDIDKDGTADSVQNDIKTLNTIIGNGQMGVSIEGAVTVTSLGNIDSIDPATISQSARPQNMDLGLFGLRMTVANPGDTAVVKIYFSEAAAEGARWYIYDSINKWVDFSNFATFNEDRMSVTVRLKDGDFGDADGIENGIIVDPCGFGIASWIKGSITDAATKEAITTATVLIKDLNLSLNSRLAGNYLSMILPGTYDVEVSAPGYQTKTISSLAIGEADIASQDVELQLDEATLSTIIKTQESGDINGVWKQGGKATTSRGDRVVWGYFYADPNDVSWGSPNNPEVYVKAWYDVGGRVDINFFHVSVPDIEVSATYNGVGLKGTSTTTKRYIRHYYNDNNSDGTSENFEDGIPAAGFTPANNPYSYATVNNLNIGTTINTVEAIGSIDGVWKLGGQDITSRGDQVVWGYFYADPNKVSWGSKNNPELFVKIWFDAGGRIDVNYFHVSVPDIEVYSNYGSDGIYDNKGTTIMDDRYIRHEYTKQ